MSYQTWHDYGYGICVDDIETTVDKVFELVHMAPEFEKDFLEWVQDTYSENGETASEYVSLEELLEYESDSCYSGLAVILECVIAEVEGIHLYVTDDYDAVQYLLITPAYPWNKVGDGYRLLNTTDKADKLFRKYVNILTDKAIDIDYQSVENGG